MSRKYEKYSVKVTFLDNSIEEIQYQGVNTSNYKEMLKLYGDVKNQYMDKARLIEFLGISENGQLTVMFKKPIIETTKPTLIDELSNVLTKIESRKEQLNDIVGILDKEINGFNHDIENIPYSCCGYSKKELDNYKISLVDQILSASIQRRNIKNEVTALYGLSSSISIETIKSKVDTANKVLHKEFNLEDQDEKDNLHVHTRKYSNDFERDEIIEELSERYQKVVDIGNGIIKYCNLVYGTSQKKKKKEVISNEKIYEVASKLPDIKNSTVKVRYNNDRQKQHLINTTSLSYKTYNINEAESYIELINKKKGRAV
jgi:hypothetical protein